MQDLCGDLKLEVITRLPFNRDLYNTLSLDIPKSIIRNYFKNFILPEIQTDIYYIAACNERLQKQKIPYKSLPLLMQLIMIGPHEKMFVTSDHRLMNNPYYY